jgi:hypothetical protein
MIRYLCGRAGALYDSSYQHLEHLEYPAKRTGDRRLALQAKHTPMENRISLAHL